MTRREREALFEDYIKRGVRELADLLVQAEMHIEKLEKENSRLLKRVRALTPTRETPTPESKNESCGD